MYKILFVSLILLSASIKATDADTGVESNIDLVTNVPGTLNTAASPNGKSLYLVNAFRHCHSFT